MARTPYNDPEAEKAYQATVANSSQPSAEEHEDEGRDWSARDMIETRSLRKTWIEMKRNREAP